MQYQTSNKVAIQIKGRIIERELTVERVVGVYPVSSRKLPQRVWGEAPAANDYWTFYT